MKILSSRFVKSSIDIENCPKDQKPEFAFIGRSNVGKSSLINMLSDNKNLAKTSSKPGKTTTINHFIINEKWYIVDLPGYGYAKASHKQKELYQQMIFDYILRRNNLYCLFILIDSRIEPMQSDIDFINFIGENAIPCALIFTKSDKLSNNQLNNNIEKFKKILSETWEVLPPYFASSIIDKTGRDEILKFIGRAIDNSL
jgi:GTP-binding protein